MTQRVSGRSASLSASLFRDAAVLLQHYAEYHRDERNISTHFFGIPMIVFGIGVLLAGASFGVGPLVLTAAWVAWVLAAAWYLPRGHFALGLATAAAMGLLVLLAHQVGGGGWGQWLAWGLGFFGLGWVLQCIGHYYEGRKPAFSDNVVGLLVGPMFVTLEALASLGLFKELAAQVEAQAGPTRLRNLAHPVG